MKNLNNTDIDRYVEIYNSQGKDSAIEYITRECQTNYLAFQRKMRKTSNYVYDRCTKKFRVQINEDQFMSLDELCAPKNAMVTKHSTTNPKKDRAIYDEIIIDLMKDRLTEIAKYILFEQSSREIHIKTDRLKQDGYTLVMN